MKRFLLFLSAIVLANAMTIGQSHAQYNSFCIYDNASDASLYTCASVDSITFEQHDGIISQVMWRSGERAVSPVSTVDSISFYNPYVEGIVEVSEGFDIWDKAYVTPIGYFSYKSALVDDDENLDSDQYETLAYTNFEDTQAATLILSKNDSLPVWLIIDSLTCTFGYLPEDSLCHLTIGCDSAVVCELEFHYNDSIVTARNQYTDHELKRCLWIVISLLEGNTAECQAVTDVVAKFKTLLSVGEEDSEPKLPKKPISKKLKVKTDVYYGVGAGTYGAYYITSSSAVLQGCVYCASAQRDSASVYGILCDENPENLTIEKAKHNFVGHQEKMRLRYEVYATGLKPNTTYYCRAYVRIKKGKNDLQYSYAGDKAANAAYGKVRKFATFSFPGKIKSIKAVGSQNTLRTGANLDYKYLELEVVASFEQMEGILEWCVVYQRNDDVNNYIWINDSDFNGMRARVLKHSNFFNAVEIDYSNYTSKWLLTLGIALKRKDLRTGQEYWDIGEYKEYEIIYDKKPCITFTKVNPIGFSGDWFKYTFDFKISGSIFIDDVNNWPSSTFPNVITDNDYNNFVGDFLTYEKATEEYVYFDIIDVNGKHFRSSNAIICNKRYGGVTLGN